MASSFGKVLRKGRERQSLTLEDAAHKTRIPVAQLEWLENDRYEGFASPTYARSFVKLYAGFLGIDPEITAQQVESVGPVPARKSGLRSHVLRWGLWGGPRQPRVPGAKDRQPVIRRVAVAPAAVAVILFLFCLAGSAVWGTHLSRQWAQAELQKANESSDRLQPPMVFPPQTPLGSRPAAPAIVKAIPVPEEGLEHLFPQGTGREQRVE